MNFDPNTVMFSLISQGEFRTINLEIARKLGSINAALFLSDLVDRYKFHKSRNETIKLEGHNLEWFYYTVDTCEERTTLTRYEQDPCVKKLVELEIIEVKLIGLPPKRHFCINPEKLLAHILAQKNSTNLGKNPESRRGKTPKRFALKPRIAHIYTKKPKEKPEQELEQKAASPVPVSGSSPPFLELEEKLVKLGFKPEKAKAWMKSHQVDQQRALNALEYTITRRPDNPVAYFKKAYREALKCPGVDFAKNKEKSKAAVARYKLEKVINLYETCVVFPNGEGIYYDMEESLFKKEFDRLLEINENKLP